MPGGGYGLPFSASGGCRLALDVKRDLAPAAGAGALAAAGAAVAAGAAGAVVAAALGAWAGAGAAGWQEATSRTAISSMT